MKAKSIYESALSLLGETRENALSLDYAERAPYLIASFCTTAAALDRDYRESHRLAAQGEFSEVYISLDETFPLSKRFTTAASHYLAAMLVLDTDEDLSDRLFEKYCDLLSSAVTEIPYVKNKTRNVYGS